MREEVVGVLVVGAITFGLGAGVGMSLRSPQVTPEERRVVVTKEVVETIEVPKYQPLPSVCADMTDRLAVSVEREDEISALLADVDTALDEVAKAQYLRDADQLATIVEGFVDAQGEFTREVAQRREASETVQLLMQACVDRIEEGP